VSDVQPADTGDNGSPSKRSLWVYEDELNDDGDVEKYHCSFAINSQRGLFYEFEWEEHRKTALEGDGDGEGDPWDVSVGNFMEKPQKAKAATKTNGKTKGPTRPKKSVKKKNNRGDETDADELEESDDGGTEDEYQAQSDDDGDDGEEGPSDSDSPATDEDEQDDDDLFDEPRTPSKKRKRPNNAHTPAKRMTTATPATTPRKPARGRKPAAPTPHSRKSLAKRKQKSLRMRPPPPLTSHLQLENLPTDPWFRAMHVLHVGARPDVLPCREEEYARCLRAVEELIEEGSGGCVCKTNFLLSESFSKNHTHIRPCLKIYLECLEQERRPPFTQ
jgi:origin recognition complex subunit 1